MGDNETTPADEPICDLCGAQRNPRKRVCPNCGAGSRRVDDGNEPNAAPDSVQNGFAIGCLGSLAILVIGVGFVKWGPGMIVPCSGWALLRYGVVVVALVGALAGIVISILRRFMPFRVTPTVATTVLTASLVVLCPFAPCVVVIGWDSMQHCVR